MCTFLLHCLCPADWFLACLGADVPLHWYAPELLSPLHFLCQVGIAFDQVEIIITLNLHTPSLSRLSSLVSDLFMWRWPIALIFTFLIHFLCPGCGIGFLDVETGPWINTHLPLSLPFVQFGRGPAHEEMFHCINSDQTFRLHFLASRALLDLHRMWIG